MGKISVGIAGAIGVLVGILIAPRKGSETRKRIVQRSEPLQQAARNAASKAGDAVKPVTRVVGERIPFLDRTNKGVMPEETEQEAVDEGPPTSEGREDGKTATRRAKPEKVGSRN